MSGLTEKLKVGSIEGCYGSAHSNKQAEKIICHSSAVRKDQMFVPNSSTFSPEHEDIQPLNLSAVCLLQSRLVEHNSSLSIVASSFASATSSATV